MRKLFVEAFLEVEVAGYEESRWRAVDVVDGMATGRLLLWGMSGRRRLCPSTPTARVYALAMGEWMKSGWSRRKEWMTSTPCHPLQWGKNHQISTPLRYFGAQISACSATCMAFCFLFWSNWSIFCRNC